MLAWLRVRVTYANVLVTVLLFIVLGGGGAYALSGHNRVKSDDIAPGAVHRADVANSTGKLYSGATGLDEGGGTSRFLDLPGFARLDATVCNLAGPTIASRVTNTSQSALRLDIFQRIANGTFFQNSTSMPPNGSFTFSSAANAYIVLHLVRGTGGQTKMASVDEFNVINGSDCSFEAQAIVQR